MQTILDNGVVYVKKDVKYMIVGADFHCSIKGIYNTADAFKPDAVIESVSLTRFEEAADTGKLFGIVIAAVNQNTLKLGRNHNIDKGLLRLSLKTGLEGVIKNIAHNNRKVRRRNSYLTECNLVGKRNIVLVTFKLVFAEQRRQQRVVGDKY